MDGLIFDFYSTDARLKEKNRRLLMELKSDVDLFPSRRIVAIAAALKREDRFEESVDQSSVNIRLAHSYVRS